MGHLHPFVAFASAAGLVVLVACHVAITRATRARYHLSTFIVALALAFLACVGLVALGVARMQLLPGEPLFPFYLTAVAGFLGLAYGYFTFVNLNTTSLRIRLCREIDQYPGGRMPIDKALVDYQPAEIVAVRLQRLRQWGQIGLESNGNVRLRKGPFLFLALVVRIAKIVVLPAAPETPRPTAKGRRPWLRFVLGGILVLSLVKFYFVGIEDQLNVGVTERTRDHAIPVAIAQIYHGQPHDYTSWKRIARPMQSNGPIEPLIRNGIHLVKEPDERTYYWYTDDRGSSDLVNLSFRVFGATMRGLYNGHVAFFVLLVAIAALALRNSTPGLALLVCFVMAYASNLSEIMMAASDAVVWTNYRVHFSETRTFEIMALLFPLTLFGLILAQRKIRALEIGCLAALALAYGFLLSCRGTVGWIVLSVVAGAALLFALCFLAERSLKRRHLHSSAWALLGTGFLLVGVMTFKGWHALAEHPIYESVGGQRTFYHNALMTFSHSKMLRKRYGLNGISDRDSIDAVNVWLKEQGRPLDDPDALLNALGGWRVADWTTHENAARDFYCFLWTHYPWEVVSCYADSFVGTLGEIRQGMQDKIWSGKGTSTVISVRSNPLRADFFLYLVLPLLVFARAPVQALRWGQGMLWVFAFSLIPGAAFYSSALTVCGGAVLGRLLIWISIALLIPVFFAQVRRLPAKP